MLAGLQGPSIGGSSDFSRKMENLNFYVNSSLFDKLNQTKKKSVAWIWDF